MAENDEESSQMSYEIERSIQQMLDTQEDEDDAYTSGTNILSNETSERKINSKFGDNASDYTRRRTQISNVDNKSSNSGQDKHIPLTQEDVPLEDSEYTGNYFMPFMEKEHCFLGLEQEMNMNKVNSNFYESDRFTDGPPIKLLHNEFNEVAEIPVPLIIKLEDHEGVDNALEKLFVYSKKSSLLIIECYVGQLTKLHVTSLFDRFEEIEQIQLVNKLNKAVITTYFREGVKKNQAIKVVSKLKESMQANPPRTFVRGHQKCKSMSEEGQKISILSHDEEAKEYKNLRSKKKSTKSSSSNNQGHKFTWRYEVQITNDKDFQVAIKLIGPKGRHMKNIINKWKTIGSSLEKESCKAKTEDLVKLRLRGIGSGFKEGPRQKESSDPLHLCVSSKFLQTYNKACQLTEDLINDVYEQYYKYQLKVDPNAKKLRLK